MIGSLMSCKSPAAMAAGQALVLLFLRDGGRIHKAKNLIEWFTLFKVGPHEPAFTIVLTTTWVGAPIDSCAWVLAKALCHFMPRSLTAR